MCGSIVRHDISGSSPIVSEGVAVRLVIDALPNGRATAPLRVNSAILLQNTTRCLLR